MNEDKRSAIRYSHYSAAFCGLQWFSTGLLFHYKNDRPTAICIGLFGVACFFLMCYYDSKFQDCLYPGD